MTDNIRYFEHEVTSFRHGKFKMLRLKYGFEGEGRFWALNCMIGESERCWLDLSKSYNLMNTAAELGLTIDQFNEYLNYLIDECKLVIKDGDLITTDRVQQIYNRMIEARIRERNRYQRKKGHTEQEETPVIGKLINSESTPIDDFAKPVINSIMEYFKFNEVNNFPQMRTIGIFVRNLFVQKQLDHFLEQFKYYKAYKEKSGEIRHSFTKFIGDPKVPLEGAWNSQNWKEKLKASTTQTPGMNGAVRPDLKQLRYER